MHKFYDQSHQTHKSEVITDAAKDFLDYEWQQSRRFDMLISRDDLTQVFIPDGVSHVVDLHAGSCTCTKFQEHRIPCQHDVAACIFLAEDPYLHVHYAYELYCCRNYYSLTMDPIREEDLEAGNQFEYENMVDEDVVGWDRLNADSEEEGVEENKDTIHVNAPTSSCQPPVLAKQRGRPKKKRFRHREKGKKAKRQITCSHCGQTGHNKATCRNQAA
jgi:hypothetical protein